jgi:hypothetical protein
MPTSDIKVTAALEDVSDLLVFVHMSIEWFIINLSMKNKTPLFKEPLDLRLVDLRQSISRHILLGIESPNLSHTSFTNINSIAIFIIPLLRYFVDLLDPFVTRRALRDLPVQNSNLLESVD